MKLTRFLSIIGCVTTVSCFYVYQQTEILRLAYAGQKKKVVFEEILDKNNFLRYNLEKSISLVRIGDRVSQAGQFQMPDNYRLVRVTGAGVSGQEAQSLKPQSLASRIFSIKRQAEAKTINTP